MSVLQKAAMGGSLRVLEAVLAAYEGTYDRRVLNKMLTPYVAEALLPAVRREHHHVVVRLVGLARRLGVDTNEAREEASRRRLESMVALLPYRRHLRKELKEYLGLKSDDDDDDSPGPILEFV